MLNIFRLKLLRTYLHIRHETDNMEIFHTLFSMIFLYYI